LRRYALLCAELDRLTNSLNAKNRELESLNRQLKSVQVKNGAYYQDPQDRYQKEADYDRMNSQGKGPGGYPADPERRQQPPTQEELNRLNQALRTLQVDNERLVQQNQKKDEEISNYMRRLNDLSNQNRGGPQSGDQLFAENQELKR